MKLNTLSPAPGSRKTRLRVGRGASAGQGKTCGRGVKGQRARKGGYHKVGFEGGQMPLQRRLPKVGFRSKVAPTVAEVRLSELAKLSGDVVDLEALKAANVIPPQALRARIFSSGEFTKAITVKGVHVTKGARAAIEAAGGKIEEPAAAAEPAKLVKKAPKTN
jgi:large subunit ribosomal protein L15